MHNSKEVNVSERLGALMARRAERKLELLKDVRLIRFNKLKSTQWNMWHADSKADATSNWLNG